MPESKRRKKADPHANLIRIATTIMQTYQVEFRKHENQLKTPDTAMEPTHFRKAFGDIKRRRVGYKMDGAEVAESDNDTGVEKRDVVWMKIASRVVDLHFDPEKFVRCQFSVLPVGSESPFPNMLLGPNAVTNYRNAMRISASEIRASLVTQVTAFKVESSKLLASNFLDLTLPEAWLSVLRNTEISLSALFRYCMARSLMTDSHVTDPEPFAKLALWVRTAAAVQYITEADAYQAASGWKEWLPTDWPEKAERIYRKYYGF